jgi:hypothetical protein
MEQTRLAEQLTEGSSTKLEHVGVIEANDVQKIEDVRQKIVKRVAMLAEIRSLPPEQVRGPRVNYDAAGGHLTDALVALEAIVAAADAIEKIEASVRIAAEAG